MGAVSALGDFSIREAKPSDKVVIEEICLLSFGPVYRYFAIQSLNSEGPVLVCDSDGAVAGFVKLIQTQIGSYKVGDILWLAVHPNFRRKNIGSTLITASVSYFKSQGANCIYASTGYDNKPAISLFQRNGFHKTGFRELGKIFGLHVLRFYFEFWVSPTEVVLAYTEPLNE